MPNVPQELKEAHVSWEVGFAKAPKDPQVGLEQGKQALRPILVHVAVYLPTADKYRRLTRRPSQEQKGLDERARMASQRPSPRW
jgi:hypothetical protein